LQLAAHGVAGTLLFALTYYLGRDRLLSSVTTIVFMVSPGYAEAVLWVSCATEVLSTLFTLATVLLCLRAADTQGRGTWMLGAAAALGAVFAHEAATALFLLVPVFLWLTGRLPRVRLADVWPFAIVGLLFCVSLALANWRNPLLTEGAYKFGGHIIRNALDYLVSLYIGPHAATGYITMTLAVIAVARLGPLPARLGVAWMMLAMLPFLGFVSGTTSRYLYAPTMGFGWMVAGLLVALRESIARRSGSNRLATVSVITLSAVIVIRFTVFTTEAIQDRLDWFDAYKEYAAAFERSHPGARSLSEVTAPYPSHPNVRVESIQPLLRWTLQSPDLIVHVEPKPSGK
jgi:4-amino-4-deoxy-L-arabinose transferase-like glycosyltransferase